MRSCPSSCGWVAPALENVLPQFSHPPGCEGGGPQTGKKGLEVLSQMGRKSTLFDPRVLFFVSRLQGIEMPGKAFPLCFLLPATFFSPQAFVPVSYCCITHSPQLSGVRQAFLKFMDSVGRGIQTEHNGGGLSLSSSVGAPAGAAPQGWWLESSEGFLTHLSSS